MDEDITLELDVQPEIVMDIYPVMGGDSVISVNGRKGEVVGLAENSDLILHTSNTSNPHSVTKTQVGLGNVPNIDATNRANHVGTQAISTVLGLQAYLDSLLPYTGGVADLDLSGHDITADNIFGTHYGTVFADNYWMAPGDGEVYIGANLDDSNPGANVHVNAGNDVGGGVNGDVYLRVGNNTDNSTAGYVHMIAPGLGWGARFDLSQAGGERNIILPSSDINLNDVLLINGKADDNAVVHLTGDESIGGVKTFSSSPLVPTPATDTAAANKLYVDTAIADVEGSDVDSFNGRTGAVVPVAGDYTATLITNTPAGNIAATTAQAAINELDTEKIAKAGDTMTGVLNISLSGVGVGSGLALTTSSTSSRSNIFFQTDAQTYEMGSRGSAATFPNRFYLYNGTVSRYLMIADSSGNFSFGSMTSGTAAPNFTITLPSVATGITPYNTADQTTNYERVRQYWNSNTWTIVSENGGTGTRRPVFIGGASAMGMTLNDNGGSVVTNPKIALTVPATQAVYSIIASTNMSGSSGFQYGFTVAPTVNASGTQGYTAFLVSSTESSTGSGVKNLMDLQRGGTSQFRVNSTGQAFLSDSLDIGNYGTLAIAAAAPLKMSLNSDAIAGVEMRNLSTGTSADFRFMLIDTGGHYLAFAQPGVNNNQTLFGLNRKDTDYIFSNGGTGRALAIGPLTVHPLYLGTAGTARLAIGGALADGMNIQDAFHINLGSTTGNKIGTATTQKLGFWNATPIVQPTTAVAAATRVGGGGTTITDTDTFDGYTIAKVVKALRSAGLLA